MTTATATPASSLIAQWQLPPELELRAGIDREQAKLDLSRWEHKLALWTWWEAAGHRLLPGLPWRMPPEVMSSLTTLGLDVLLGDADAGLSRCLHGRWPTVMDAVPGFSALCEFTLDESALDDSLPPALRWIWRERPDLRAHCAPDTASGRLEMIKWWLSHGHREYGRISWRVSPDLTRVVDLVPGQQTPLPGILARVVRCRPDLQSFCTPDLAGWFLALVWWVRGGQQEFDHPGWALEWNLPWRQAVAAMAQNFSSTDQGTWGPLTLCSWLVWKSRPDLMGLFDIGQQTGHQAYQAWWQANGQQEYAALVPLLSDPLASVPGLNVVGFARSVIGIAEDVRMAVKSAQAADIAVSVIDAPMSGPASEDHSLDALIVDRPAHRVALYCLPPPELARLQLEGGQRLLASGTYNIGGVHWELPSWPEHLNCFASQMDEIWVYTRYVKEALGSLTDKPVVHMPLAVEVAPAMAPDRSVWGLPPSSFLFLVMFDGKSWVSRKNPAAAIHAFRKAFPTDQGVGLVIKAMGIDSGSVAWQSVASMVEQDSRIHVINKVLDKQEVWRLMASCDAYVSLHRAEGFGRIIAEAMLLGVPTVTTNFSGNTDFCLPATSYLVDGPLVPLKDDDYLFARGQHWCDPDIDEAAQKLRELVDDRRKRDQIVVSAQQHIERHYSVDVVGAAYRKHLQALRARGIA